MAQCYKLIVTSLSLLTMSACTVIPGGHIEGITPSEQNTSIENDMSNVNFQVIDFALLQQQKASKSQLKRANLKDVNVSHYEYILGVGDVLSIGVWDHPELTIPAAVQRTAAFDGFRIQADGTITYAYAANIPAAGKTIRQLHDVLVKRLSRIIEKPQIDIKVVGFNSQKAYVTGEVNKPGVYAVTEIPLTLIDALNQAGGLNDKADWRTVTFTRGNKSETIQLDEFYENGDISQNRLLQHGDIIHVNRTDSQKVFVLGDVSKASSVEVHRYGLSLAEALTEVGGLNEATADANGIFVLRKRDLQKDGVIADVYQLHAKNVVALVLADEFKLEPRDIIYVTTAPIARWNRLISQLLPTIGAIDTIYEIDQKGKLF
ncbi:polysaccharide biosynthesis protein [Pseudoalteromonas sp. NBT06-2]|uniref:polysaccharide export protein n=1 Tax=Pseudoalteromonas sp. NBT06-2 TaxID=2025950 RepID=UPI000BA6FA3A|nr:polysaccharide export protein [Pseudoalteromonas sp. NBT06-2]PAJ74484.1 polysaccharide biosynthesis protein [Pseudoalteromonas sp. NBT06-2]